MSNLSFNILSYDLSLVPHLKLMVCPLTSLPHVLPPPSFSSLPFLVHGLLLPLLTYTVPIMLSSRSHLDMETLENQLQTAFWDRADASEEDALVSTCQQY